jgi:TPR repeat protein
MYSSGSGVAQNDREAIKWYEKAATVGDPQAKARLAEIYSHGKGVPKDISKALQFYKEAASAGIPIAQYNLGYMYLMGENLPQDFLRAEYLFRRAGEQGFLLAMVNLAQMYTMGLGTVPKDLALARKWLELAAPYDTNAKKLLCSLNEVEQVERIHVGKDNRNREEILNS